MQRALLKPQYPSFLEFEALKFLHEVAHDPLGGTDQQDLWTKMGRYIYSTFTTQLFGLEVYLRPPLVQNVSGLTRLRSRNLTAQQFHTCMVSDNS